MNEKSFHSINMNSSLLGFINPHVIMVQLPRTAARYIYDCTLTLGYQ